MIPTGSSRWALVKIRIVNEPPSPSRRPFHVLSTSAPEPHMEDGTVYRPKQASSSTTYHPK